MWHNIFVYGELAIFATMIVLLVYLAIKRIGDKRLENFEDRDN